MDITETKLSQSEQAYRRIEEMIIDRTLPPGSMLSEKQLCAELDCGRTPIREALQRLNLEGYIQIMPSRGALVAPVDVVAQLEMLEMRRPLEELLVRLAADRATGGQRERLRALAGQLCAAAEAGDSGSFLQANRALQQTQCEAAHNSLLAKTMLVVYGQSRRFWFTALDDATIMAKAATQHCLTAHAIADGRAADAAESAAAFLLFLEELTRAAIDRRRRG